MDCFLVRFDFNGISHIKLKANSQMRMGSFLKGALFKIGANFEFLPKSVDVSNLFLKGFLCEKEDHWLCAGSKPELSTTYPLVRFV